MTIKYGPDIIYDGIVDVYEANTGVGTNSLSPSAGSSGSWQVNDFTEVNGPAGYKYIESNTTAAGLGTSHIISPINDRLYTGSITFLVWFNVNNIPTNVSSANNWRGLLCTNNGGTSGSPLTSVMEQAGGGHNNYLNYSTTHTDRYRRYINGVFAPVKWELDGWNMYTYTYDQATGIAAAYKNDTLVITGPMTENSSGANPTTPGLALSYGNYTSTGFRVYGGSQTDGSLGGNGPCPGFLGSVYFYNRALSGDENSLMFNNLKGRYGL